MKKIFLLAILTIFIYPVFVFGAAPISPGDFPDYSQLGVPQSPVETPQGLLNILAAVVGWVYTIFFIIAVLFILFAAYNYLTKSGEPEKIKEVHKQLIYAAIAVVVALLAVGFSAIISNFLEHPNPPASGASTGGAQGGPLSPDYPI